MPIDVLKVLLPTTVAFAMGILGTPILTHFLYKHKMWKKKSVQNATGGGAATITAQLHGDEERKTPRMGGIVIWGATLLTTALFALLATVATESIFSKLTFFSRNQVWLPLFTLIAGALCGLIDDYLVCHGEQGTYAGGGLSLKVRLVFVALLGFIGAWWFYDNLQTGDAVHIPFYGIINLDWAFIPFFVMYVIGMYSGGIIDGVDGLSGGVFSAIYTAMAIIAFTQHQTDLATFCAVIVGGLLAFLWFNIPPARFFNSETGTMGLTTALVIVAFLERAEIATLIIALPLIVTAGSSALQILSKKLRGGKKIFLVAPLHNHFQAIGWPPYKVTMRYWVVSMMLAVVGVIVQLSGVHM
jgi:phospho-N-acetylmuramoyl-pentapeptide-transferase